MNYKSTVSQPASITDLSFEDYNKRQLYEISAERNSERALSAKPAGNFIYNGNSWQPQEYEGFAVVSMLSENEENGYLAKRLIELQKELQYNLTPNNGFYFLPADSFHQTVANTLSADRFKNHILNAGLEDAYPAMVAKAFENIPASDNAEPIRMTRPFIGHITLAYVEQNLNKNQKDQLPKVISELNETLATEENYFSISFTGLRRYHHLAEFIKQDNYPVCQL